MPRRDWTRPELLEALRLYVRLPFGQLHHTHADIIKLAERLGRTPSAVSMKACNFASLDPAITSTGRRGLTGASVADRALWSEFLSNPESLANEIESTHDSATLDVPGATGFIPVADSDSTTSPNIAPTGTPLNPESRILNPASHTEIQRLTRTRCVQSFFRAAVLTSYNSRCAITGLAEPQLLNASHIIPWRENIPRRADPTNGLCLNALFDRAFDRGLITFDADLRVVVSPRLQEIAKSATLACSLLEAHGRSLTLPSRFTPDREAIEWHRTRVFAS